MTVWRKETADAIIPAGGMLIVARPNALEKMGQRIIEMAQDLVERPTLAELGARLGSRRPVQPSISPAQAVRSERDSR